MREVTVQTGARLHFGLFDLDPTSPTQFGGIGMMIDSPGVTVRASLRSDGADMPAVTTNNEAVRKRVLQCLGRLRETYPALPQVQLNVPQFIPSHNGLGSGTQLAVAVGTAVAKLANVEVTTEALAIATGRGRRSAIGVHGFQHGGFIVDGGHVSQQLGTMQHRVEVPEDWRIILLCPNDTDGLSGSAELQAFQDLPAMPTKLSRSLQHLVHEQVLPSLTTADFDTFSSSLHEFGQVVGNFFAPVQGGTYRSATAAVVADQLRADTPLAIVQSSWGPTVAVFTQCQEQANDIASRFSGRAQVTVTRPRNQPAMICELG